MTHILACSYSTTWCSNGNASQWVLFLMLGIVAAGCIIGGVIAAARRKMGLPPLSQVPREPFTDSPFTAGLITGRRQAAFTSRYRAVTPGGITVTGKCCQQGHTSPAGAVAHASQVAERIGRTGR